MVRNFIYLDSEKLRSLSSQLFEGVAEATLYSNTEDSKSEEWQKGPVASGRTLADIFSKGGSSTQLKFLEDHAYTLFENEIVKRDLMIDIQKISENRWNRSFIKVSGNLQINDTKLTSEVLGGFNNLGLDMTRVINQAQLESNALGKPVSKADVQKLAKKSGFQLDGEYAASLSRVIEFGFHGMLEFQIEKYNKTFSSPMKRDYLRESENVIVQKYSRYSECEFTLIGIMTRFGGSSSENRVTEDVKDSDNLKQALRSMTGHLDALEDAFSGLGPHEVTVDPIAVYRTL